jgi:hypothetical protein
VTCQTIRQPKQMYSDLLDFAADHILDDEKARAEQRALAAKIRGTVYDHVVEEMWWTQCGSGKPEPQCSCGAIAEFLCDYPMGKGKTCDMGMCDEHRNPIGAERDLCIIHLAEFRGAKSIGEWPPRRVR